MVASAIRDRLVGSPRIEAIAQVKSIPGSSIPEIVTPTIPSHSRALLTSPHTSASSSRRVLPSDMSSRLAKSFLLAHGSANLKISQVSSALAHRAPEVRRHGFSSAYSSAGHAR